MRLLLILLFSLCGVANSVAQTYSSRSLHGPDGGSIYQIEVSPAGVYFVRALNTFKHGPFDQWFYRVPDFISSIAIDSNSIVYGASGNEIGRFTNDRFDFETALIPFAASTYPDISIVRSSILTATSGKGIAMYVNGNWIRDTLPGAILKVANKRDTLLVITTNGLYKTVLNDSEPYFGEWLNVDVGLVTGATCIEFTPIGVLAGTHTSGVFLADSVGGVWRSISENLPDWQIKDIGYADGRLVVGTGNNLYMTSDLGSSWIAGQGRIRTMPVEVVAPVFGGWYAGTSREGIFHSSDNGESWEAMNVGIDESRVTAIQEFENKIWTGSNFNAVHAYDPNSETWKDHNKGLRAGSTVEEFMVHNDTLYALEDRAGIYKWVKETLSWVKIPLASTISSLYTDMQMIDDKKAIILSESVYILDMTTHAWTRKQFGEFQLHEAEVENNKIYIASDSALFVSIDAGASWQMIYDGATYQVAAIADTIFIRTANETIKRSTNQGETWAILPQKLESIELLDGKLYGVKNDILISNDRGDTWNPILTEAFSNIRTIYRSSDNRILIGPASEGLVELTPQLRVRPSDRRSSAVTITATPNPFNSTTVIAFDLPESSPIDVTIFNSAGQKVKSLVAGEFRSAGPQSMVWDASRLATGSYYVSLRIGGQVVTEQVVVRQ